MAATLALLLSLGLWQLQRLEWKRQLLADIAARSTAPPLALAEIEAIAAAGGDVDYRRMAAQGRFDHARERHFFATFDGQPGFFVHTPLVLEDGRLLFVNRGFVPYDLKLPRQRPAGQIDGTRALTGLARARLAAKPSWLLPENDLAGNIFYWKDLDAMALSAGLEPALVLPFFMDADAAPENPGGLPRGGVTRLEMPDNHLAYALTWFGLAGALLAVVAVRLWRTYRR